MRFSIDVGSELELKLYQAVLLYRNDHGNRYMATVHGVVQQRRRWNSTSWSRTTAQYGQPAGAGETAGDQLSGGVPARTRRRSDSGAAGMVDAGGGAAHVLPRRIGTCRHFRQALSASGPAVRGAQQGFVRPRASCQPKALIRTARLAAAPYWNIDSNGAVCAGTMRTPKSLTVTSIAAWQQAFFQSEFTHPGGGGRLTKRQGGTAALWKSLAGKKRFPLFDAHRAWSR